MRVESDLEQWGAGCLHGGDGAPETTLQRERPAAHRAGIGLADGAGDRIHAARAGAATAVNRGPVKGVLGLGAKAEGGRQKQEGQSSSSHVTSLNNRRRSLHG